MNRNKRILLLFAYAVISAITCFFFLGSGHGPFQPLNIMDSWGVVGLHLLGRVAHGISHDIGLFLFFAMFFLYPLGIMLLHNALRRITRIPVPIFTLAIHAAGTWVGLKTTERQSMFVPPGFDLLAWIVPILIVLIYLFIEWRLARGVKKPEPAIPVDRPQTL